MRVVYAARRHPTNIRWSEWKRLPNGRRGLVTLGYCCSAAFCQRRPPYARIARAWRLFALPCQRKPSPVTIVCPGTEARSPAQRSVEGGAHTVNHHRG